MGEPFTDQEVHQLAFGLPEQWVGVINRDRWCAHGASVMDAWNSRVQAEKELAEREAHDPARTDGTDRSPPRAEPWPVAFYGRPD